MLTAPAPTRARRIGIFVGLCWLYTSLHMNRQILSILADSVKSDLGIDDAALGALTGSAFSIVYALLGLHFGALADRANRLALVRAGAWVWSLATIGGAFASSYAALVAVRAGVAFGEAIATAAAVSLMSELAGDRYRARAASAFSSCAFIGAGLAAISGGALVAHFHGTNAGVGWRLAMGLAAVPGILGALYLSFYRWGTSAVDRTPRSAATRGDRVVGAVLVTSAALAVLVQMSTPPNLGVPLAVLLAALAGLLWALALRRLHREVFDACLGQPTFRLLLLAFAAVLFVDFAASFWLFPLAQRRFGLDAATVGAQLGGLLIAGGIAGSLVGGVIADRWRRGTPAGRVWTVLAAALAETAALMLLLAEHDYRLFLAEFAGFCLAGGGWTGVAAAIGFDIVPRAHRGIGVAAYFLVTTVFGPGLGAWAAGALADASGSITVALLVCCPVTLIALLGFVRLGRALSRERAPL